MVIAIVGGGASGLMAAIAASKSPDCQVHILERQSRVGRKLLATGNGRCNLTNTGLSIHAYHGEQPDFADPSLQNFGLKKTLSFFQHLGLLTVADDTGRVYPWSDQAGSVVDVLRFALEKPNVHLHTGAEVTQIRRQPDGRFLLSFGKETLTADRVIAACGGLAGTGVRLNVDYLAEKAALDALAEKVVYTGPVDAYFGYRLGALQYRSVRFETEVLDTDNYQGNAVVNYTDAETPYTRIIEHKHFEFGTQPKTVISREYSAEWKKGDEPYYPVNDEKNGALYAQYKALADAEPGVIFGGRLGEYKYYDMDKVIEVALDVAAKELA